MSPPSLRVAICGGGIGGLALATTLGRYANAANILVDIYESAPHITTVGAGISIWPRTWKIMERLGLTEDLQQKTLEVSPDGQPMIFVYRRSDREEDAFTFHKVALPAGSNTLHRADMLDIFHRHLPSFCAVHTSKRLVRYTENTARQSVSLYFADGSSADADILVGADGIKSTTRTCLFDMLHQRLCVRGIDAGSSGPCVCGRSTARPTWTGTLAYRSLIPIEQLPPNPSRGHTFAIHCGKNKHVVSYPISRGKYLNVVAFYTVPNVEGTKYPGNWVTNVPKDEIVECYKGWEQEVQELVEHMENPSRWAIHVVDSLSTSVSGRTALLGDAVHAMATHLGAGAGQAIEDAYVLGRLLARLTFDLHARALAPSALRIYDAVRLPSARAIVRRARLTGLMYEFAAAGYYDGVESDRWNEREELARLGEANQRLWRFQFEDTWEGDWVEAQARIEDLLSAERRVPRSSL